MSSRPPPLQPFSVLPERAVLLLPLLDRAGRLLGGVTDRPDRPTECKLVQGPVRFSLALMLCFSLSWLRPLSTLPGGGQWWGALPHPWLLHSHHCH